MLFSLRTEKAVRVLDYLKKIELQNGGIRAWLNGEPYPEVTGYLIPTLLKYGEPEMARRCADYLISVQNKDGSFNGLDGVPRSFDTAAAMEGLRTIGEYKEEKKARKWLAKMRREDGAIRIHPQTMETHLYTMRVSWLLDSKAGAEYWTQTEWESTREHYVAYALEGLWNMGYREFVKKKLQSRDWLSEDLCANAQFAILFYEAGINFLPYLEYVRANLNMITNSWEAKWVLDCLAVTGG